MEDLRKFVRGLTVPGAASMGTSASTIMSGIGQRQQCSVDDDTLCAGAELHEFFTNKLSAVTRGRQRLEGAAKTADAEYASAEAYCKRIATDQKVFSKEIEQVAVISSTVSYLKGRITSLLEAMDAVETALDAEEAIIAQSAANVEIERQKAGIHVFVEQKERELGRLEDTLRANIERVRVRAEEEHAKKVEAEKKKVEEALNKDIEKWKREHNQQQQQQQQQQQSTEPAKEASQESTVEKGVKGPKEEKPAQDSESGNGEEKKDLASVVIPPDNEEELEKFLNNAPAEQTASSNPAEEEGKEDEGNGDGSKEKGENEGPRPIVLQDVEPDQQ